MIFSVSGVARVIGAFLMVSACGVEAGSRIFEPLLTETRGVADGQLEVHRDSVSGALDFVPVSNTTTAHSVSRGLHKRYWVIDHTVREAEIWPNGVIRACFERQSHLYKGVMQTTDAILRAPLEGAMELWRSRGLNWDRNMFRFEFIDSDEYCAKSEANKAYRHEFLLIRFNNGTDGKTTMNSSVGKTPRVVYQNPLKPKPWEEMGPLMLLAMGGERDESLTETFFAHEIGHVLGLYHEQQNPLWWRAEGFGGMIYGDDPAFDEETFDCSQLHDYEHMVTVSEREAKKFHGDTPGSWEHQAGAILRDACRNQATAARYEFSALAFLPEFIPLSTNSHPRRTEPDYKSIMIYPSRMNGKKPPGATKRNIVFRAWDMSEIKHNLAPSLDDIAAIKMIYGVGDNEEPTAHQKLKVWLGDKSSAARGTFLRLMKKEQCQS